MNQAVKWELVSRNVADAVDPPKQASEMEEEIQDMVFLNEEEIERLLNGIKGTYLYLPAYIAINTGMRMGEVLGLRWKDIDLKRETLTKADPADGQPGDKNPAKSEDQKQPENN